MPETRRHGRSTGPRGPAAAIAALALALSVVVAVVAAGAARAADDAEQMALGKALFTQRATPPCALCHTLKDAGATGAVGPVLDELQPDEARVTAAVRGGIGAMPSFKDSLKETEIQAIARYVAKASRSD